MASLSEWFVEGEKEEENTLANSRLAEGEEGKEGAAVAVVMGGVTGRMVATKTPLSNPSILLPLSRTRLPAITDSQPNQYG